MIKAFFLLLSYASFAITINGVVRDSESQEPLVGASVSVVDTRLGAISNSNGEFKIENINIEIFQLKVSMIGYRTKIIRLESQEKLELIKISLDKKMLLTNEVIVSANKRVQNVQDVPISYSFMDSKDIEIRQLTNLEYALEYVPGIQVTRDNVSIRGSSGFSYGVGSRVALLIDGFPLLAGDNGDIKMDALPFFNMDRVEIVKGAGSALYGTSAIGGVINVITQDIPKGLNTKYRFYGGYYTPLNHEEWRPDNQLRFDRGLDVSLSNKFGKLSFISNLGLVYEDSYRVYDQKELVNGFAKINYDFDETASLSLNSNLSISDNDDWAFWESFDNPFQPASTVDFSNRIDSDKLSIFANYKKLSQNYFYDIKAGAYYTQYSNRFEEDNPEFRESRAMSYSFLPQITATFETLVITSGLDIRLNDVKSVVYDNHLQTILAAYTQAEIELIQNLNATAGVRYDIEMIEGLSNNSQFSPKLGLNYKLEDYISIRASGGYGFRVPQIAERFAQINFQGLRVTPNPDLLPERSISYEIGMTYEEQENKIPIFCDVSLFQNFMENLIEPAFQDNLLSEVVFMNVTSARISGVELSAKTFLFDLFGLELSATVLDPINTETNEVLPFRSKYLSQNRFMLPLGDFRFELDYKFFARMEEIDERLKTLNIVNDANIRNNAHVFDARISYNLRKLTNQDLSLTLNAFNLFNYYYTQMVGNMGPTRRISLMLQGSI